MAFITPSVVAAGDPLTETLWNQDVVANTIAIRNEAGLVHLGTFTTTGTQALSAQSVFTTAFSRYHIKATVTASSDNNQSHGIRMMSGSSAITSAIYVYASFTFASDNASGQQGSAGDTNFRILNGSGAGFRRASISVDVFDPAQATFTQVHATSNRFVSATAARTIDTRGGIDSSASYDGFQIFQFSGTMSATLDVYGYAPKA
jgi:hypothetical protein